MSVVKQGFSLTFRWTFSGPVTAPTGGPDTSLNINGSTPGSCSAASSVAIDANYGPGPNAGDPWTLATQPATFAPAAGGLFAVPASGITS